MARSLIIKTLAPGLVERGKIKIGEKGKTIKSAKGVEFQPPKKLDHFVITTTERGPDGNFLRDENMHRELGEAPVRIPVRLLYDDVELNYQSRFVAYNGTKLARVCDGEICELRQPDGTTTEAPCVCAGKDPFADGVCKPYSVLSVILDNSESLGGVWKFRSTSYNTARGLLASMLLIQRVSGGLLAGIPLDLVVGPKQVTNPKDGKQQTIYVVHLEYRGSLDDLQNCGHQLSLQNASRMAQIRQIEANARELLSAPDVEIDDEDTVPEFFPEQAEAAPAPNPAPNSVALDLPTVQPPQAQANGRNLDSPASTGADPLASARRSAPPPDKPVAPQSKAVLFYASGEPHSEHTTMGAWLDELEALVSGSHPELGTAILDRNAGVLAKIAKRGVYDDQLARIKNIVNAPAAPAADPWSDVDVF